MLLVTWNNILEPFQLQLHCCRLYWNKEHIKGSIPILLIGAVRFDKSNISQQYIMTLLACFTSYITHCTSLSVVAFGFRSSSLYFCCGGLLLCAFYRLTCTKNDQPALSTWLYTHEVWIHNWKYHNMVI